MSEETSGMQAFGSAELVLKTQLLVAEMDRRGTKVRVDEWEFDEIGPGKRIGIRLNYAHHEQRIHLLYGGREVSMVSVNISSTDPIYPSLDEMLMMIRAEVAPADSAIHRAEQ